VEAFVELQGRVVMKRLILDRGFWGGFQIGRCKQEWGINVLIPVRHNMEIFQDVLGLAETVELSLRSSAVQCLNCRYPEVFIDIQFWGV
jgi:hypothetical protein